MRKIFFSVLAIVLLGSCKKEAGSITEKSTIYSYNKLISDLILPDDANAEVARIAQAVYDPTYTFGITDNPNYGTFSSAPEYDIFMSGSTPNSVSLILDGITINNQGGQWLHQSIDYKQYYGKNVEIEILSNGNTEFVGSMYVPEPARINLLSTDLRINRTGNTLSWEVDQEFPGNKVALAYSIYSTSDLNDLSSEIDRGVLLIDNNGTYTIDHLLTSPEAQKIYFRLVTGNAVSTDIEGEKVVFTIKTYDHHLYVIN